MVNLIRVALFCTFLLCFVDFAPDAPVLIGQLEYRLFSEGKVLGRISQNPFVLPTIIGQLLFIISFIYKPHSKLFTRLGFLILSLIICIVLVEGLLKPNIFVLASTIPFIGIASIYLKQEIQHYRA
jgi:hypothetical protein